MWKYEDQVPILDEDSIGGRKPYYTSIEELALKFK
jgi:hypothetical protein